MTKETMKVDQVGASSAVGEDLAAKETKVASYDYDAAIAKWRSTKREEPKPEVLAARKAIHAEYVARDIAELDSKIQTAEVNIRKKKEMQDLHLSRSSEQNSRVEAASQRYCGIDNFLQSRRRQGTWLPGTPPML